MIDKSYSKSFTISAGLHFGLLLIMLWSPSSKQAVLEAHEHAQMPEQMAAPAPIQAVSVDAQEVEKVMHKLQAQKEQAAAREIQHQKMLAAQAEQAKRAKLAEMKQLQQLKQQAENLKRQQEKMQQESKKIAAQQEKQLAELKAKQLAEEQHLEQLKKAKEMELAKAKAAQAKADAQAAQQRMAGEVDRYKALILNAIRDQWILPESVDPSLSSQFVIRLAPTGSVLEVHLSRSSGDVLLDRSAQAAIYKASPLPVPHDANTFNMFREITLTVRPSNSRG